MNNYAVRIHRTGGPEQLVTEEVAMPEPGMGEVLVRNTAIGLNFIDAYHRSGLYPMPLPLTLGSEGAGVIEKLGAGIADFKLGDRVAYLDPIGAYSKWLTRPLDRLVKIPAGISDEIAAAALLKGVTAQYLIHSTYAIRAGETILVHSAAGGVGQILCQWAKRKRVTVIGTVGSARKIDVARAAGCDHVINAETESVSKRVREITSGRGVPVVYDGIGQSTFIDSLDCLATRGFMVSYGAASGPVPPFALTELIKRGSLYVTRPSLSVYTMTAAELRERAADVFAAIRKDWIKISINARYPLTEAAAAHTHLEARKTTGSTILLP